MTFPEAPSMIVPMLLNRLRDHLESDLTLNVAEDNPTRAVLVKTGRFQDNPLEKNVSIAISGGDFEDPSYLDGRVDNNAFDNLQIPDLVVGQIGGGTYWWRRGSINFQAFFVRQRLEEQIAMNYAYDFYGRLIQSVETTSLNGLQDDYGEEVFAPVYVEGASFFESGGSNQFIWRGKLLWRVLTWRQ